MARTTMTMIDGTIKFADTEGGLAAATDWKCQVTSPAVNGVPKRHTVPATLCEGESQIPGKSGWEFALAWLQDWNTSGGGLSNYLFENETLLKWFTFEPTSGANPTITGQCYLVAGPFGGEAGGAPAVASVTMGLFAKPSVAVPA